MKSDKLVDIVLVFSKLEELLVIKRSIQLGLLEFLQQVGSVQTFFAFISKRNCERQGSDYSALKSPMSIHSNKDEN